MRDEIPNEALLPKHLPKPSASWREITGFAVTFHAYASLGGFPPVAEIANRKARNLANCSLTDLRAALYFETRRYRHFGCEPDAAAMRHIHGLVEEIRRRLQNAQLPTPASEWR